MSVAAIASGVMRSSKFFAGVNRARYFSRRWLVASPSHDGVQRPKSVKLVVRADALHFFQRRAGAIRRADQRAHAGSRDRVDVNARVAQNAQHPDVRDAAREASRQRQARLCGRAGTVRFFRGRMAHSYRSSQRCELRWR